MVDDAHRFIVREHHGQLTRLLCPDYISNLAEWSPEYFVVQKHQRVQRLCLRGCSNIAMYGKPGQKLINLRRAHIPWVFHLVETNEVANPVPIGFLGTDTVMIDANNGTHLIAKARLLSLHFGLLAKYDCMYMALQLSVWVWSHMQAAIVKQDRPFKSFFAPESSGPDFQSSNLPVDSLC